jgi:hypothetical protein
LWRLACHSIWRSQFAINPYQSTLAVGGLDFGPFNEKLKILSFEPVQVTAGHFKNRFSLTVGSITPDAAVGLAGRPAQEADFSSYP